MNSVTYDVTRLPAALTVGRQTETGVMAVRIDCTGWLTFWPGLTLRIFVTAPGGAAAYPAKTHMEGKVLVWDVSSADTMTAGKGSLEVVGEAPGKRKLSAITETNVLRTTTATTGEPPEQIKTWFEEVQEAAATASAAMAGVATATAKANAAADRAESAVKGVGEIASAIVSSASGNAIVVSDSANRELRSLTIYGRTTQNGTPTPDAPVTLESVGAGGAVSVSVGIPEGGNEHITIITQPRSATAPAEAIVRFHVNAVGDGLTYQWMYSTDGGVTAGKLYWDGATTETVTFNATETRAANVYWCNIADANGNTVSTNYATLTIGEVAEEPDDEMTARVATPNGLHGVPVASGGNYTDKNGQQWVADSIEYDTATGKAKYVQRIKQVTLDGSETWSTSGTNVSGNVRMLCNVPGVLIPSTASVVADAMCNKYVARTANETYVCKEGISIQLWAGNSAVIIYDEGVNDVATWKAALSANPVECQFVLTTPVVTELSADQFAALRSFYPTTVVYNSEGAHMAVGYVADTKTYIDNLVASAVAVALATK